jgi:hypothetical protein
MDDEQALEIIRELMDNITASENYRLRLLFAEMVRGKGAECGRKVVLGDTPGGLLQNRDGKLKPPEGMGVEKVEKVLVVAGGQG